MRMPVLSIFEQYATFILTSIYFCAILYSTLQYCSLIIIYCTILYCTLLFIILYITVLYITYYYSAYCCTLYIIYRTLLIIYCTILCMPISYWFTKNNLNRTHAYTSLIYLRTICSFNPHFWEICVQKLVWEKLHIFV